MHKIKVYNDKLNPGKRSRQPYYVYAPRHGVTGVDWDHIFEEPVNNYAQKHGGYPDFIQPAMDVRGNKLKY